MAVAGPLLYRICPTCSANELNDIILGVLGRAQRLHEVELVGFVFLSTHFHLIARVTDARQLAGFMGYLASNLAREIARHTGWTDRIWARRYQAIIINLFLAAFRDASEKLRSGDRNAKFPTGGFPPGLPFVTELPLSCAPRR